MSREVSPFGLDPFSGQLTGVTGTPTDFPSVEASRVLLGALPGNSDAVYFGATTGTLGPTTGFALASGSVPVMLEGLRNLNDLGLFVLVGGDGVSFLSLYDPLSNPLT